MPRIRKAITFRCSSMSEPGMFHTIYVSPEGMPVCSCQGESFCSHIDSTLLAGERYMIPASDWKNANIAAEICRGKINPPTGWQAHWRKNRKWRGLPTLRSRMARQAVSGGKPLVAIIGRGEEKQKLIAASEAAGWIVSPALVDGCAFLVVPSQDYTAKAVDICKKRNVPIAVYAEWEADQKDLAKMFRKAIAAHRGEKAQADAAVLQFLSGNGAGAEQEG